MSAFREPFIHEPRIAYFSMEIALRSGIPTVLPLCHGDRAGWAAVMKGAITRNAAFFNGHRMMRRYAVGASCADAQGQTFQPAYHEQGARTSPPRARSTRRRSQMNGVTP